MARPLRIEFPGALYHVTSRGNERKPIVRDDADRQERLDWLRRTVETYGWRLHAFVLMRNHDHVFVETPEPNLSAGMQYLNGSYTSYFNRRHRRCGHLLQGRFKGHLIEQEGYFLEVSRYIHLNPVRAKAVARPEDYHWSSYQGYIRAGRAVPWVTYARVLGEFGRKATAARRAYSRFVRAATEEHPPSPFVDAMGGLLVGSERFITKMRGLLRDRPDDDALPELAPLKPRPALQRIVETVAAHFGHDARRWQPGRRVDDASRAVAAYVARRHFGYSAGEVATALGYRGHGGVHSAVARVEAGSNKLKQTAEKLSRKLH
ncbi:MAG: transposase [Planctomycetota bacterium]|jgi:REP element-mobilizing transposase RayT